MRERERDFEAINPIVVEQKYSGKSHRQCKAKAKKRDSALGWSEKALHRRTN